MAEAINPTYDLAHEDVALARRRAMAEAMMKQALEPVQQQTAGGYVVPITGMQGLAKVAQALLARNEMQDVGERTKAADADFSQRLGAASEAYAKMREQNPMEAFKAAMTSGIKPLMQLAMQDMRASQMKPSEEAELYNKNTPESIQAWKRDKQQPLVQLPKPMEVNGHLLSVDPVTNSMRNPPIDMRTKWGPVGTGPTGIPMQTADTGEAKGLTGGNVTPDRVGEVALERNAADLVTGGIKESYTSALEGKNVLKNVSIMEDMLRQGAKTGPLTDMKLYASKLAESFGIPVDPKASTEVMLSTLGEQMLADIRKLAPVTQEDIKVVQSIKGGSVTGEAAIRALLRIAENKAAAAIVRHNSTLEKLQGTGPATQALKDTQRVNVSEEEFPTYETGAAPVTPVGKIKFLGIRDAQNR